VLTRNLGTDVDKLCINHNIPSVHPSWGHIFYSLLFWTEKDKEIMSENEHVTMLLKYEWGRLIYHIQKQSEGKHTMNMLKHMGAKISKGIKFINGISLGELTYSFKGLFPTTPIVS
jgi:hypothetical protein